MIDPSQPANQNGQNESPLPTRRYRLPASGSDNRGPPPVFNIPPGVKLLILILIAIHIGQRLMPDARDAALENMLGFFPYRYWLLLHGQWAGPLFLAVVTPLTYMFLHANWLHLGINVLSLAAFGSAVERMAGARVMVWLFLLCGVCGAFTEFAVDPTADTIVIGASAGISGLFAIAFMALTRLQTVKRGKLWGAIALVVATMVVMGHVGIIGMNVAWMSHIGGFAAGLLADACLSRREGTTHLRNLRWFAAIIILPLLVLVMNVSRYF